MYLLYANRALRAFIEEKLSELRFEHLKSESHLIICATNFSRGRIVSFYVSSWIDRFKAVDQHLEPEQQRLTSFVPIRNKGMLIDCLLASAAIPEVFPPVQIRIDDSDDSAEWFVDGGVGNNTPTREAAYFLRHVNTHGKQLGLSNSIGELYCVTQDPPGVATGKNYVSILDVAGRTYEVFSYLHMQPIVSTWERINREIRRHEESVAEFESQIAGSLALNMKCASLIACWIPRVSCNS